jgi:hypothetical protein
MSRKVALTTAVMVVATATVVMTEGITSTLGADGEAAKNQCHMWCCLPVRCEQLSI